MSEHFHPTDDEIAFDAYLDALAPAMQHRSREQPLRDYCTGLLLPDGRKSVEPMAARLAPAAARTRHKTLLNFVADGAWSDEAVLAAMRGQVLPAMQALGPLRFWIVDETGMPKKGEHSVGVARQYCGELGKIESCQVLVSLSVATDAACLPIAARLYLPETWAHDDERRATAAVPLDVAFQTKPALALEQIRVAHAAGVPPGVVLADEVYGSTATFRQGVAAVGLDYAVAVRATTEVLAPRDRRRARLWRGAGRGAGGGGAGGGPPRPPGGVGWDYAVAVRATTEVLAPRDRRRARLWRGQEAALTVRALAGRLPRPAWRWVSWREGSGPALTGRFAQARVRVGRDGGEGEQTLLVEWPVGERDPLGYWLVTLPAGTPLITVVATAKGRGWVEQGYPDLKQEGGPGAHGGRGWRGLHHPVTPTLAPPGL